jgi:Zn-dependent M16 (insulinase) family peptidase
VIKEKDRIEFFDINAYKLEHQETGAKWLHMDSSDLDNVFAVLFRTPPDDHTGKPHILEHLALCGSTNYPVRDPFFNMIKRSLNTYMNAWTGSDFTMYPFSSQNA